MKALQPEMSDDRSNSGVRKGLEVGFMGSGHCEMRHAGKLCEVGRGELLRGCAVQGFDLRQMAQPICPTEGVKSVSETPLTHS